ncbi:MAG: class IV adenylate cyclase [Methanoregula sp.]|nr:MAG: class IV adenylate cyclase [Methanoregula sp.]
MLEIELKVRVDELGPVRERLHQLNAEPCGRVHEHDIYYNAPHRNFAITDEALRVRYSGGKAVMTYKGAKIKDLGLKAREELNTAVESGEVIGEILARLGFTGTAEVDKWRENYRYGNASISLDEVEHLGTFVEIEVIADTGTRAATERIDKIKRELGITGEAILASYLELLQSRR